MERETKTTIATASATALHNVYEVSFKECRCPAKMTRDEEDDGNRGMKLGNYYDYCYYYFIWHKHTHIFYHTHPLALV